MRRAGVYGAGRDMIDRFKAAWPCHGLPDDLECVVAHFERSGDLVDIEAFGPDGAPLECRDFDGSALKALVDDIQTNGYEARPEVPDVSKEGYGYR